MYRGGVVFGPLRDGIIKLVFRKRVGGILYSSCTLFIRLGSDAFIGVAGPHGRWAPEKEIFCRFGSQQFLILSYILLWLSWF